MAASNARRTTRAAAPQQAPKRRPELKVHDRAATVRRIRPVVVISVIGFLALAFGAVALQINMVQRQQKLDAIRTEISKVQEDNKTLRQRESLLQSPGEILRIAESELGMVPARPAEVVRPAKVVVGTPPADSAGGEG